MLAISPISTKRTQNSYSKSLTRTNTTIYTDGNTDLLGLASHKQRRC